MNAGSAGTNSRATQSLSFSAYSVRKQWLDDVGAPTMANGVPFLKDCSTFCELRFAIPVERSKKACESPSRRRSSRLRCPYSNQYSSSGRKIPSLPNNRASEMIRGCEIRSISGRRPPPRPLHDHPVEHRLVVHGFSRRRREGARRPCRAL